MRKRADSEAYAKKAHFDEVWVRVMEALGPDRFTKGVRLSLKTRDGSAKYVLAKTCGRSNNGD